MPETERMKVVIGARVTERARLLDRLGQEMQRHSPEAVLAAMKPGEFGRLREALDEARRAQEWIRSQMIYLQEESDWEVYFLYGLVDESVIWRRSRLDELALANARGPIETEATTESPERQT